ncbi:hypothetical protein [Lutibacter sp.]
MKSIKFIFAFFLFSIFLTSCTSDNLSVDETLYQQDSLFATGDDGAADIDRDRD